MLSCHIEGRNLVNGVPKSFNIADGAVFIDNYNETLDSGTIVLPHLTSKIEIEPYDVVVITGDNAWKRLCVDSFTCTQTSLDPEIYKYEISLFSETKMLEGIVLPNLKITKVEGIRPTRKVYDYLSQYVRQYSPKVYVNGSYMDKFYLGDTMNRFAYIECPEMQWNQPTLREVLNDLTMVDDCIVILRNNAIECIDISELGNEITNEQKSHINYITESQSSADYVSDIKMQLVNVANNSLPTGAYSDINDTDLPKDATRIIERIGFRNSESYLLTTENMRLETSFPIWKIYFCRVISKMTVEIVGDTGTDLQSFEMLGTLILKDSSIDYILEYNEWLTKDVYYGSSIYGIGLTSEYRNTCLYYVRGAKNIQNFDAKREWQSGWITATGYFLDLFKKDERLQRQALEEAHRRYGQSWDLEDIIFDFKDLTFEVCYEPIDECVFTASKTPLQRNKRTIIDNQTNSYVDAKRQGMLEYLKANRLGNKMITVNGRYNDGNIPELASTINGKVIFRRELAYYENHINANFYATENYVLRDYYTGVKSKIRSWRVISGNEALLRAEHLKFFVNGHISNVVETTRLIPSYSSVEDYLSNFKYCVVRFNTENSGTRPSSPSYAGQIVNDVDAICVEFSKHIVGNSVVFTIRMPDNYWAGTYISNYSGTNGRVEQKGIGYTDDNGEITGGTICFYGSPQTREYGNYYKTNALKPFTKLNTLEDLHHENLVCQIPFTLKKDNGEILQISIQFEVNEEADDMFLGKR